MVFLSRILAALALALLGGGAFAQVSAADGAFDRFYAQVTGVGKQTVSFGSGGQVVVGQGVPQISTSGGPVNVDRSIPLRNNSGGVITANARVAIPPGVLAKILQAGAKYSTLLAVGAALYDVFTSDLGLAVENGKILSVPAPPGGYYDNQEYSTNTGAGPWYPDWATPCAQAKPSYALAVVEGWPQYSNLYHCQYTVPSPPYAPGTIHSVQIYRRPQVSPPPPLVGQEVSDQQLADLIAQKSGWPASSRVAQAVADVTAREPAPSFPATPTVTGPASSPGTVKSKQNPDGSNEVKTTTHNHTYQGNTVNTTTTTVTSTCNGGSCNTTTETEEPKLDEQPFSMPCGIAGTPPCAVKVDDSGMPPDGGNALKKETGDIDPQKTSILDKLGEIEEWDLGEWSWTFQLPTGCTPLPMFLGVEINPCQWQEEIHDVMTVIWLLTGIAGCFVIFSRAFQ